MKQTWKNWIDQTNTMQQKEDMWHSIIDGRQDMYKRLYNETDNNDMKIIFRKLPVLEFEGGTCWMCGKKWVEKRFNNKSMAGRYYIPDCECFVKCPICHTHLYDLQFKYNNKLHFCDNCNFQLHNMDTTDKRYGKAFENYYDGLSEKDKIYCRNERFTLKDDDKKAMRKRKSN